MDQQPDERMPLPSEDSGDLVEEPVEGVTDDPLVATEEGVPWAPPTERVMSEPRADEGGVDAAGSSGTDAGELEREDGVQFSASDPGGATEDLPRDDELRADVVEALRASDVSAGDRLRVSVTGSQVTVDGEVESVDVVDEIVGIVGDVPGVTEVVDEIDVTGI